MKIARRLASRWVTAGVLASSALLVAAPANAAVTTTTFPMTGTESTLPQATLNHPYSVQLDDGSPPGTDVYGAAATWPRGMTMSASGLISGTPELPEKARVFVTAYNPATRTQGPSEWLDITVGSGEVSLDPTLVPLGTTLDATITAGIEAVEGPVSTLLYVVGCLATPDAPPSCLLSAGL